MAFVPGQVEAQERMVAAKGQVFEAFDGLACGLTSRDAFEFLSRSPAFDGLSKNRSARMVGAVLGFAIVAVEADRARRVTPRGRRWFRRAF